jgi:hypothetical protein
MFLSHELVFMVISYIIKIVRSNMQEDPNKRLDEEEVLSQMAYVVLFTFHFHKLTALEYVSVQSSSQVMKQLLQPLLGFFMSLLGIQNIKQRFEERLRRLGRPKMRESN